MKHLKSALSVFLVMAMLLGILPSSALYVNGSASSDGERIQLTETGPTFDPRDQDLFVREDGTAGEYKPDDIVRVSIVLGKEPAINKCGLTGALARNKTIVSYRRTLENDQKKVIGKIEKKVLDGGKLEVVANLTLVANLISADVEYGRIKEIENVSGVKEVVIERVYNLLETADGDGGGAGEELAKAVTKPTGAGVKIAIIDSGVNHDHEAFSGEALDYSLKKAARDTDGNGEISDEELESYKESIGFMTRDDVAKVIGSGQLHATSASGDVDQFYHGGKIPFAYNYCDSNLSVKNAEAGYHGSHVSGIAAANSYLKKDGTFVKSDENGGIIGTAPDAQILNMKVMGAGSCTDSTIATAIEDAVLLGADVMNMSLGISQVGFSCAGELYGSILDNISQKGILISGAIGNDGSWLSAGKKLYADDVNMSTTTPPSSYAEVMGVARANKNGVDGERADIESSSAYGIPSSLMLQPEITAAGTKILSVNGNTDHGYDRLSGTSMASPDVAGAAAVLNQYVTAKQSGFGGGSFLAAAKSQNKDVNKGTIAGGLLMSTADPMKDKDDKYYSLLRQGAGLLNTKNAVLAKSFIEVEGESRGRVKAEVGDSPDGSNRFEYSFTLHNVSDEDISYILKTDLFTEDAVTDGGSTYLAGYTRKLMGSVGYKTGGKIVAFDSRFSADVDNSGVTDYDDAIALLDYLTGKRGLSGLNLEAGDVDKDGKKTTYDAYLILSGLETSSIRVKANSAVTIEVTIEVTEDLKDTYKRGAYLEGFTYVTPAKGGADVTHSIPILGFCGNWSDPSMFDRNSYIESQNKTNETVPYTLGRREVYEINYLEYQDPDGNILRQSANPFDAGKPFSLEQLAMGTDDSISSMKLTLIRPAGALCFAAMKNEGGKRKVLYLDAILNHVTCIYPTGARTGWNFHPYTLSVHVPLKQMLENTGVKPGDKIEIGAVAVPEYYEETPGKKITADRLTSLIEGGKLGTGAYMTTVVTLDNEAPEIVDKSINVLAEEQKITFKVKDDQHVAYVGLRSTDGKRSFISETPEYEDGEYDCTFSASWLQAGGEYSLVVGDYAGNVRMYRFTYGKKLNYQDSQYTLAYVRAGGDGILTGTWIAIEPSKLNYSSYSTRDNGVTPLCYGGTSEMLAGAEATGDYLWQAYENGLLYVSPVDDLSKRTLISNLSPDGVGTVRDLAFNESDGKLYAVDGSDTIWQIDPMSGRAKPARTVFLEDGGDARLYGLAIDKAGAAYITCCKEGEEKSSLIKIGLSGQDPAAALDGDMSGVSGKYISLTWTSADKAALYASSAGNLGTHSYGNILYRIELTGSGYTVSKAANSDKTSRLQHAVRGLVNLSAKPGFTLAGSGITGINICNKPETMFTGDTVSLVAVFNPWNVDADPADITYSSSGEQTAGVTRDGRLTAKNPGTVTITASYTAGDGKTVSAGFDITVKPAPKIELAALLREGDGRYYFEAFSAANPGSRKKVSGPQGNYIAGTMNHAGNSLYVRNVGYGFRIDPDDFTVSQAGGSFRADLRSGDAAPGKQSGLFTNYGFLMMMGSNINLVGSDAYSYGLTDRFDRVGKIMSLPDASLPGSAAVYCYGEYLDNYSYEMNGEQLSKPADIYYAVTEDGTLCKITFYDEYSVKSETIGKVDGVNLSGVPQMNDDYTASMIYDEATRLLVVISKIGQGAAKIQVIDPITAKVVMTRRFEEEVRQVGILYQHDYSGHPAAVCVEETGSAGIKSHLSEDTKVDSQSKTVTVEVPVGNTTNGLIELTYDQSLLSFKEAGSALSCYSCHDNAGTVKFAFAGKEEIGRQTVRFVFGYEPQEAEHATTIKMIEKEKGDPKEGFKGQETEKTVTLPAKPAGKSLLSIEVTRKPDTMEYVEGATFDPAGMELTLNYDDGTSEIVTEGWTLEYDFSKAGTQTVKVTYGGIETGITVTVVKKQMQPPEPQKPGEPQQPVAPDTGKEDESTGSPQTGDNNQTGLWLMFMLLSGGVMAALSDRRKRRQSK